MLIKISPGDHLVAVRAAAGAVDHGVRQAEAAERLADGLHEGRPLVAWAG